MDTDVIGEFNEAASAIAAHGAFAAIGVVVLHFEIEAWFCVEKHQTVRPDTKTPVAKKIDLFCCEGRVRAVSVVYDNKVVTGSLVFIKVKFHQCTKLRKSRDANLMPAVGNL